MNIIEQNRKLTVHPNLIFQTIHSQAGSLAKALLEGVMNSCDAESTQIEITLNENSFKIVDDGAGFESEDEIYQMFEQFGTPHQDGDARFGRFRIGRGQLFSYSISTWHSNNFTMVVDIKNKGLDYTLTKNPSIIHNGCIVLGDLYNPLSNSELQSTLKEIHSMVKWIGVDVVINGEKASSRPEDEEWDHEDEFAFYRIKQDTQYIDLYNQGALVDRSYIRDYGVGAIVVSKQALTLNQARNSILESQCEIYPEIRKKLKILGQQYIQKKPRLTQRMREYTFEQFLNGEISYKEISEMKLIKLSNGKALTLYETLNCRLPVTIIENGYERTADMLMQSKKALILSREMLDCIPKIYLGEMHSTKRYKRNANNLFHIIRDALIEEYEHKCKPHEQYDIEKTIKAINSLRLADFLELAESISDRVEEIHDIKLLSKQERAALKALRAASNAVHYSCNAYTYGFISRKLIAGESDVAEAWTDGAHWIAFEKRILKNMHKGYNGLLYAINLLTHEYAHDSDDTDSHDHDFSFFEKFHDLTLSSNIGNALTTMHRVYGRELIAEGLKLPQWLLKMNGDAWTANKRGAYTSHDGYVNIAGIDEIL